MGLLSALPKMAPVDPFPLSTEEAARTAAASSIIGSGEEEEEEEAPSRPGEDITPHLSKGTICLRFLSRLSSSLIWLAICSGVMPTAGEATKAEDEGEEEDDDEDSRGLTKGAARASWRSRLEERKERYVNRSLGNGKAIATGYYLLTSFP